MPTQLLAGLSILIVEDESLLRKQIMAHLESLGADVLHEVLSDLGLHLRLPALAGMPFRLESSSDLVNWEEEASGIVVEEGVSYVEDAMGEHISRFFRVVHEYGELNQD